jgi:hypothetical protein
MWVRFLDKKSSGTLFNFGNPTRNISPTGFNLETITINEFDLMNPENNPTDWDIDSSLLEGGTLTWGAAMQTIGAPFFENSDSARFIRLVVREHASKKLRDSHFGISFPNGAGSKNGDLEDNPIEFGEPHEYMITQYTHIPTDLKEWYFIVATYNPDKTEDEYLDNSTYEYNTDFWNGNLIPSADTYVASSDYGNKCKVEIISRSELLRARGYRT